MTLPGWRLHTIGVPVRHSRESRNRADDRSLADSPNSRRLARFCVLLAAALIVNIGAAGAAETCRFAGNTDFAGHAEVTTTAAAQGGLLRVQILARFDGRWLAVLHIRHFLEETSVWHDGQLQSVAVNTRDMLNDRPTRQQWDIFQRTPQGFQAHRIEGKSAAEFGRKFPLFAAHWSPASFGESWERDFWRAGAERRVDLDLAANGLSPRLMTPLALAFYWLPHLSRADQTLPVFLPGFKHDKVVPVALEDTAALGGGTLWQAAVRYPGLSDNDPSVVRGLVGADGQIKQLAVRVHRSGQSAQGSLAALGCSGSPRG